MHAACIRPGGWTRQQSRCVPGPATCTAPSTSTAKPRARFQAFSIHLLVGFSEFEDELIRLVADCLVEHFGRPGVRRIGENRTLRVELEPGGFDLSAHGRGLDAMQSLGYIGGSASGGGMIENDIKATGLQRTVDGLIERSDVDRAHELVVQVMVIP
jgi:hypothetical protein